MGLEGRVPYPLDPNANMSDPFQAGVQRWATQPPIGCNYVDDSLTFTTCTVNVNTTLAFLSTAGNVQYDPYNMIDIANDLVTIPFPGIWDVAFEIYGDGAVAAGDVYIAAFGQGTFTIAGEMPMSDQAHARAASDGARLAIAVPYYISRSVLNTGSQFRVRALALNNTLDMKIVTFSMHLRSANVPSKY